MMSARIVGYVRGMSDAKMPKLSRGRILIIHDVRPMLNTVTFDRATSHSERHLKLQFGRRCTIKRWVMNIQPL